MPDGDDGLDVVQHPQLGTLKFPKDMPIQERNDSIDRLEMKTGSGMMQRATGQAQESIRSQIPTGPLKEETPHYTQKVTPGLKYDPYSPLQTTKEIGKTAKGELAAGGSLIAPEALPAMGIFGTAAATGGGAGVGTMIGQGATGENPFSADSLKESGINAALYGGGSLIGSLPAMRASIASKMYTPAGEFTPGAKAVTSLKPMLGVTGDTGDYITRKLFPEPAENVAERSAIANQGKIDEMGAARNKEVADWERLREQDAQSRMRRPEADPTELDQYGLPKNPANPDIGPLYSKIPSTMPKIGASNPGLFSVERPEMEAAIPRIGAPTPAQEFAQRQLLAQPQPEPTPFSGVTEPVRQPAIPRAGSPTPAQDFLSRQPQAEAPPLGRNEMSVSPPERQAAIPRAGAPTPAQDFAQRQAAVPAEVPKATPPGRGAVLSVTPPERQAFIPRPGSGTPAQEFAARQAAAANVDDSTPKIGAAQGSPLIGARDSGVTVFPEPNPLFPGENPNYAASIPRGELEDLAQRGKPGAGTQLQQLGRPVIYRPKGVWDDEQ